MNRTILQGDVLEKLSEIKDETIDVVISSPPYWGLRDYGVDGQLGLEPDFRDYLKIMSKIMTQLKRVLKNTGTCWINLGDTYAGGNNHSDWSGSDERFDKRMKENQYTAQPKKHLAAKSRYGIPERFYINCIDDGWIARNHIPWYKANSMPSSVKDRFTNKWESLFFFAKNQKYYFNLDAVREKTTTETKPFNVRVRDSKRGLVQEKLTGGMSEKEDQTHNNKGEKYDIIPDSNVSRLHRERENSPHKQDNTKGADGKPIPTYEGFNERWQTSKLKDHYDENGMCLGCGKHFTKHQVTNRAQGSENRDQRQKEDYVWCNAKGKNPGDVFFINPRPFPEAHFATFPVDLPLKILKCACPKDGIVLDPFFGAGTVGVAAEQLGLQWCGIEMNEEYIKIAKKRLDQYMNYSLEMFS